jgi:hypothetical protein
MSGATLAAGPRIVKAGKGRPGGAHENAADFGGLGGVMGSFRVIEMQLMAFIVVFSASGLVPLVDILFPLIISLYSIVLSAVVFPRYKNAELVVFQGNRLFQGYVVLGTVIGLFLPLAYVLGGFARNDQESVRAATPHLFLLSCQVLSENLVSGFEALSLPVRAIMPILYNTRRLFALADWTEEMFFHRELPKNPTFNVSCPPTTTSSFSVHVFISYIAIHKVLRLVQEGNYWLSDVVLQMGVWCRRDHGSGLENP